MLTRWPSFNGLFRMTVGRLQGNGHEVDAIDLYRDGFDPRDDARPSGSTTMILSSTGEPVEDHVERLLKAEALVMAIPYGITDFRPSSRAGFRPGLPPGREFRAGRRQGATDLAQHHPESLSSRPMVARRFRTWLMGDPPRKIVNRMLRATVKPGAPVTYLAHYEMNLSTDDTTRPPS
jgi:NAD(P)H dehydrogenase (quinone)